jgi:hypothetical protein
MCFILLFEYDGETATIPDEAKKAQAAGGGFGAHAR